MVTGICIDRGEGTAKHARLLHSCCCLVCRASQDTNKAAEFSSNVGKCKIRFMLQSSKLMEVVFEADPTL